MDKKYFLTEKNIDVISDEVASYMEKLNINSTGIIKGRLIVETILLAWLEKVSDSNTKISITMGKNFLRPYICLQYSGEKINPLAVSADDDLNYYKNILNRADLSVNYSYNNGANSVKIDLPMVTLSNTWKILIAIISAIITTYGLRLLNNDVAIILANKFVSPLLTSMINFLSAIAAFVIFFNILGGVLNMGNVKDFNKVGFRLLRFIIGHNFFAIVIGMTICFFAFDVVELQSDFSFYDLEALFDLFVGIFPNNLIRPFIDGDTLKIIFLAISFGVVLLVSGNQTNGIVVAIKNCNDFFSRTINYFCALSPVIIYLALADVLLRGNLQNIWSVGKIILVVIIISFVYLLQDVFLSGVHSQIGIKNYLFNLWPIFKIGLITGNAAVSGELFEKTCKKISFDKSFYEYGSFASQVLTQTGTVIVLMCTVMGFKEYCGQTMTISEFIVSGIVYLLIAPSTFSVPGGSISIVALLLSQNFLPDFCINVYIATNLIFDMLITSINAVCSVNNLVGSAWLLDMLKFEEEKVKE